jgi:hypothetical protein
MAAVIAGGAYAFFLQKGFRDKAMALHIVLGVDIIKIMQQTGQAPFLCIGPEPCGKTAHDRLGCQAVAAQVVLRDMLFHERQCFIAADAAFFFYYIHVSTESSYSGNAKGHWPGGAQRNHVQ